MWECVFIRWCFSSQTNPPTLEAPTGRCGPEVWEMIHHDASGRIQQLDRGEATCGLRSLCERQIHREQAQLGNMLCHTTYQRCRHGSVTTVSDSIIIIISASIITATIKPSVAVSHLLVSKHPLLPVYVLSFIAINNQPKGGYRFPRISSSRKMNSAVYLTGGWSQSNQPVRPFASEAPDGNNTHDDGDEVQWLLVSSASHPEHMSHRACSVPHVCSQSDMPLSNSLSLPLSPLNPGGNYRKGNKMRESRRACLLYLSVCSELRKLHSLRLFGVFHHTH